MDAVLESLFGQVEEAHQRLLLVSIFSWTLAFRFYQIADQASSDRIRTPGETSMHEKLLENLAAAGQFIEQRLGLVSDESLNTLGLSRAQLLADLGELEMEIL